MVLWVLVEVSLPRSVVLGSIDWVFWVSPSAIKSLDGINIFQHTSSNNDLVIFNLSSVSQDDLVLVWLNLLNSNEFTVSSIHVDSQLSIWVIISLSHFLHFIRNSQWVDLVDRLVQNDHTRIFSINSMIEMS